MPGFRKARADGGPCLAAIEGAGLSPSAIRGVGQSGRCRVPEGTRAPIRFGFPEARAPGRVQPQVARARAPVAAEKKPPTGMVRGLVGGAKLKPR